MKISTKGRYALHLMLDLADNYQVGFVPLKDIAQRQMISIKYLEQIIRRLTKESLVLSARGAMGGYKLARAPEDYTVGEILRLLEGDLAPVSCADKNQPLPCPKVSCCATAKIWQQISAAVDEIVDNITLADLLRDEKDSAA